MGKKPTKSKKEPLEKGKKDFVAGTETEEQFEKVLSLLSEWMKAGIVDVKVDADGDVEFDLPSELDKLLGTQVPHDLAHENVTAIIRNEVPALISAGLNKKPERRLRIQMPEELHEKIDIMVHRSNKAISRLMNKNLKERILLRQATSAYVVGQIQSMACTYHVELEKDEKMNVPHISLEFTFAKPHSEQLVTVNPKEMSVTFGRKDDMKVTVDLHKDDIKDLIKKLKDIEEKMSK